MEIIFSWADLAHSVRRFERFGVVAEWLEAGYGNFL